MAFSCDDLEALTEVVAHAWLAGESADWSQLAGTLAWTCTATADHAVDTVLAPAFFLASRKTDGYPAFLPCTLGPGASAATLVEGLWTACRMLQGVVLTAGAEDRAAIWRGPPVTMAGPPAFVPRAGLELILHAHDVCLGLGVPFSPQDELCERLRWDTQAWPYWHAPGWHALDMRADPWLDLLASSGRAAAHGPRAS